MRLSSLLGIVGKLRETVESEEYLLAKAEGWKRRGDLVPEFTQGAYHPVRPYDTTPYLLFKTNFNGKPTHNPTGDTQLYGRVNRVRLLVPLPRFPEKFPNVFGKEIWRVGESDHFAEDRIKQGDRAGEIMQDIDFRKRLAKKLVYEFSGMPRDKLLNRGKRGIYGLGSKAFGIKIPCGVVSMGEDKNHIPNFHIIFYTLLGPNMDFTREKPVGIFIENRRELDIPTIDIDDIL